jgi:hypothetical protein
MEHKPTDFDRVITGHESWLFLYYPRGSVWTVLHHVLSHQIQQKSKPSKFLISIFGVVNEIHCHLHVPNAAMSLCQVWLGIFDQGVVGGRWKDVWYTWTMHVLTIRGYLKGEPGPPKLNSYRIRPTARTLFRATSSLDISKKLCLTTIARSGQTSWRQSLKFSVKLTKQSW